MVSHSGNLISTYYHHVGEAQANLSAAEIVSVDSSNNAQYDLILRNSATPLTAETLTNANVNTWAASSLLSLRQSTSSVNSANLTVGNLRATSLNVASGELYADGNVSLMGLVTTIANPVASGNLDMQNNHVLNANTVAGGRTAPSRVRFRNDGTSQIFLEGWSGTAWQNNFQVSNTGVASNRAFTASSLTVNGNLVCNGASTTFLLIPNSNVRISSRQAEFGNTSSNTEVTVYGNVDVKGNIQATGNLGVTGLATLGNLFVNETANVNHLVIRGNAIGDGVTSTVADGSSALVTSNGVYQFIASANFPLSTNATLTEPNQPNITSLGTLEALSVNGTATVGNVSATNGNVSARNLEGNTLTVSGNVSAGNVSVGNLRLSADGVAKLDNWIVRSFQKTLPTTAQEAVEICTITQGISGYTAELSIVQTSPTVVTPFRLYKFTGVYNSTGTEWRRLVPLNASTAPNVGWGTEIRINTTVTTIRLVRLGGTQTGNIECTLAICQSRAHPVTIADSVGTASSVTLSSTPYENTLVAQVRGNVGINTDNPGHTLDVNGALNVAGNSTQNAVRANAVSILSTTGNNAVLTQGTHIGYDTQSGGGTSDFMNKCASTDGGFRFYRSTGTGTASEYSTNTLLASLTTPGLSVAGIGEFNRVSALQNILNSTTLQQGAHIAWNYTLGVGETDFINKSGGGTGGFRFYNTTGSGSSFDTDRTLMAEITPSGFQVLGQYPIQFKKFSNITPASLDVDTGYTHADWHPSISQFAFVNGDIQESGTFDIVRAHFFKKTTSSNWFLLADFVTHNENDNPYLVCMFVHKSLTGQTPNDQTLRITTDGNQAWS